VVLAFFSKVSRNYSCTYIELFSYFYQNYSFKSVGILEKSTVIPGYFVFIHYSLVVERQLRVTRSWVRNLKSSADKLYCISAMAAVKCTICCRYLKHFVHLLLKLHINFKLYCGQFRDTLLKNRRRMSENFFKEFSVTAIFWSAASVI
jgi:hypothetical protein